jgi:hypothetical protein
MVRDENILAVLFESLNVKHTRYHLDRCFMEHPHRDNLYGISDILSDYGIENKCVRFTNNKHLPNIDSPFIAHLGNNLVVVTNITNDNVSFVMLGKKQLLKTSEFCKYWNGIVLIAEITEKSIEPDYKRHKKIELYLFLRTFVLLAAVVFLCILLYIQNIFFKSLGVNLLLFSNLIGGITCLLLLHKQIHKTSNYGNKLCSVFGMRDCNSASKSKLFGVVGWAEVGLSYFISNVALILAFPNLINYLIIVNFCAIPYTVWSVWYQKFRMHQWCFLCLMVQLVVCIILFISIFLVGFSIPNFDFFEIVAVTIIYLLPFLSINIIVSKLVENNKVKGLTHKLNSIKSDEDVFLALLKKQKHYDVTLSDSKILWGNPNASMLITILTNPHCMPCSRMHVRMEKLLQKNQDKVCVQYILSSFDESLHDSNRFLINAYLKSTNKEAKAIYNDWFTIESNLHNEFSKNEKFLFDAETEDEFNKHNLWIKNSKLIVTPTILVNGYQLDERYTIEDLIYCCNLWATANVIFP